MSGPGVAQGYWLRPSETEQTFDARLEGQAKSHLRTGDLGFLHDGELFITGRLKELIIIRGRNHYPQDIERLAEESHPAIRPGHLAAFSIPGESEERLALVAEVERDARATPAETIAAAVRRTVAEACGVLVDLVVLIRAGTLPRTSSGKIQRAACRGALLDGTLEIVGSWCQSEAAPAGQLDAPRTAAESSLAAIWRGCWGASASEFARTSSTWAGPRSRCSKLLTQRPRSACRSPLRCSSSIRQFLISRPFSSGTAIQWWKPAWRCRTPRCAKAA